MNLETVEDVNERIGLKMVEDKDFCLSIVNCKDKNEVKEFLNSNGIEATDADVDDLARNISEIADICTRVDDKELEKIVGGAGETTSSSSSSSSESEGVSAGKDTSKVWVGLGVAGIALGGLGLLSVIAAGIKRLGDKKGWWTKRRS